MGTITPTESSLGSHARTLCEKQELRRQGGLRRGNENRRDAPEEALDWRHGYEISTALIECLNSVEKRAAIETGQEVDRQDINLRGKVNDQTDVLRKTFTFEELRVMQDRMQATIDAERTDREVDSKSAFATTPLR